MAKSVRRFARWSRTRRWLIILGVCVLSTVIGAGRAWTQCGAHCPTSAPIASYGAEGDCKCVSYCDPGNDWLCLQNTCYPQEGCTEFCEGGTMQSCTSIGCVFFQCTACP
jgi:hypothetical protein